MSADELEDLLLSQDISAIERIESIIRTALLQSVPNTSGFELPNLPRRVVYDSAIHTDEDVARFPRELRERIARCHARGLPGRIVIEEAVSRPPKLVVIR